MSGYDYGQDSSSDPRYDEQEGTLHEPERFVASIGSRIPLRGTLARESIELHVRWRRFLRVLGAAFR